MALAGRLRPNFALIQRMVRTETVFTQRSGTQRSSASPNFATTENLRNYATAPSSNDGKSEAVLADNGRLRHIESINKSFLELTMAHRGEVKATVTTVIGPEAMLTKLAATPPRRGKQLKDTLQGIIGHGKMVKLEQKIDQSILRGLVVEFGQKLFDMSIRTGARQMFLRDPFNFESF